MSAEVDAKIIALFEDQDEEKAGPEYGTGIVQLTYRHDPGTTTFRRARNRRGRCLPLPCIQTRGSVAKGATIAWIYVAYSRSGKVKIGITSRLNARMFELRTRLHASHPVLPSVAREIETDVLALLGRMRGDGEWVTNPKGAAWQVVLAAVDAARRRMHVDPHLTADEAKTLRVALANVPRVNYVSGSPP